MLSNMMCEAVTQIEQPAPYSNLVTCSSAQAQYCDLFSRLGISDPADATTVGIGRAHLASQREGKTFLEPLLGLHVQDAPAAGRRSMIWHPWGCIQEQDASGLRIRLTAAYAAIDVLSVRIELLNVASTSRNVRLWMNSRPVDQDRDVSLRADPAGRLFLLTQTSEPTSTMQIRSEPRFRIVTGFEPLFQAETALVDRELRIFVPAFDLKPGCDRVFDLRISAATFDLVADGATNRVTSARTVDLLESRLAGARVRDAGADVACARERWERRLSTLPVADVEPEYRPLIQQAAVILLMNSIRPQPEQSYGTEMGGHIGTFPARAGYEGFWIWDCAKHAWGLRHVDAQLARENIEIMLHHQREDGGLFMIYPDSKGPSTQPPLFADAALRIHAVEPSRDFLASVYPKLCRWNDWWFATCDPDANGLAAWPDNLTSGWDDSPRWDTDIPAGPRQNHGAARFEAVDLNSFLVVDLLRLADMADILGRPDETRRHRERAEQLRARIRAELYCEEDNLFYDRNRETGEWNRIKTTACFMPLWAGVPLPPDRAKAMLQDILLNKEHFFGTYPFPTVAYSEPRYDAGGSHGYWRGPVWLDQAWFMLSVLDQYRDALDEPERQKIEVARRRILDMVKENGFHENYNSQTGRAGVWSREHFSWSAAAVMEIAKRRFEFR